MKVEPVVLAANTLGEGPCWHPLENKLYWVDIKQRLLQRYDPLTRAVDTWRFATGPSAVAPRAGGGLIVAAGLEVGVFGVETGRFESRIVLDEPEHNRTNDGRVGADGRFWFGVMDAEGQKRTGALYRLDPDWRCTRMIAGMGIPNAVTTNRDATRLYVADSADHLLYVCELEASTGALGRPRIFAELTPPHTPDGAALDADDHLWSAQWDGWRLVRYAPDGAPVDVIDVPVARPTSCAFGDVDLRTLYITTAREGLDAAALEDQPLAGALLAARAPVAGALPTLFRG